MWINLFYSSLKLLENGIYLESRKNFMGANNREIGVCRICGFQGKLSEEHVPPKAAFNNKRFYYEACNILCDDTIDVFMEDGFEGLYKKRKAKKYQGGIRFRTLCEACNNKTGGWYAKDFADWTYQGMGILLSAKGYPTLYYPTWFYPLRVIKQIITMIFSVFISGHEGQYPDLVKFILNKNLSGLDKKYRIYCYYNLVGQNRYIGDNFVREPRIDGMIHVSEITFPPYGFVFTINSPKPDHRLTEITHFVKFGYNELTEHYQRFSTLPTHLPFPLDYRTKEEIAKDIIKGKMIAMKNKII